MFGAGESPQKGPPAKPSKAVSLGRGGSTERGNFRPRSEATDAQSLPTEGQHRVCLVVGTAAAHLPHYFRAEARAHFICNMEETT